jgi:hypothetical protein
MKLVVETKSNTGATKRLYTGTNLVLIMFTLYIIQLFTWE